MKLVLITWEDSNHRAGWTSEPAINTATTCRSVGWMVAKDKSAVTIASNMSDDDRQRLGDMTIPRSAIVSIRRLK